MAGSDDPLIPAEARDAWNSELNNFTAGSSMGYDVQIWGNTLHAFSIRYSDTFYAVLAQAFGSEVTAEGVKGIIAFNDRRRAESFDRVDDLFEMYGLTDSSPSCDRCVAEFAANGGCEVFGLEAVDAMIPVGCEPCENEASVFCMDHMQIPHCKPCGRRLGSSGRRKLLFARGGGLPCC